MTTGSDLLSEMNFRDYEITLWPTILGRTPLDEWSAWRRDLYLTTHDIYMRQTSMHPAWFEPATPVSERADPHLRQRGSRDLLFTVLPTEIYCII